LRRVGAGQRRQGQHQQAVARRERDQAADHFF
jgi:hypothetical protein